MSMSNNKFNIFINIFVHYPEIYNSEVINRRMNIYFNEYFSNNKPSNSEFDGNTYVTFKSAPSDENQMIKIDIVFSHEVDESINKHEILSKWEDYLFIYFDRQIPEFYYNFTK